MLQNLFIVLIIVASLFMAYRRGTNGERGYAYAWLACALINTALLIHQTFFS